MIVDRERVERAIRYRTRQFYAEAIGPALSPLRRRCIVMFHIGRSGSSVLADLLDQDRRLFWDGEIYRRYLQQLGVEEHSFDSSQLDGVAQLDVQKLARRSGPLTYGFEIKFHHLRLFGVDLASFIDELERNGVTHVVLLERKNHLAKIVSSVRAHNDGRYHATGKTPTGSGQLTRLERTVAIDFAERDVLEFLEEYRRDFATARAALARTGLPVLELSYEEHLEADPTVGYTRICELLDLDPRQVTTRLRRIRERPGLGIENVHDVRQWLVGTDFEWMCD